ncbi:MAG: fibrillarin-like rRNA/tRNA 2'-O-methyltransferase [Thaumarchaeota archaeon]|nr:fibrillarin-like rRNA/tRNA 2'-O-methyltransferase [Nitrososphaerota archaeon]MCL5067375.1 fibrillarin-like rRNA/tRNA 2'-O-methyltransferase [Nitrososphaerota archaeon]
MNDGSSAVQIFEGVFRIADPRNPNKRVLTTKNLTVGRSVYGEQLVRSKFDGEEVEFRSWDPFRSKLSAAVLNGLKLFPFKSGTRCLYLGASTGTTVSHLSDIVGEKGRIFAVEVAARVARELLEKVVKFRKNVVPVIEDAKHPERYSAVYGTVSVVYCDIAQPDQTSIAIQNCRSFLEESEDSTLFLVVKASSIDAIKDKKEVFDEQEEILRKANFQVLQRIDLEPYDKNHAMIVARPRI